MKKKFFYTLGMFLCTAAMYSCTQNVKITDKEVYHIVDSVEFHGVGQDHTMQTTPYWKVHFKDADYSITSLRSCEVGDTIKVIERTIKKIEHGK